MFNQHFNKFVNDSETQIKLETEENFEIHNRIETVFVSSSKIVEEIDRERESEKREAIKDEDGSIPIFKICTICLSNQAFKIKSRETKWFSMNGLKPIGGVCMLCSHAITKAMKLVDMARHTQIMLENIGSQIIEEEYNRLKKPLPLLSLSEKHIETNQYDYFINEEDSLNNIESNEINIEKEKQLDKVKDEDSCNDYELSDFNDDASSDSDVPLQKLNQKKQTNIQEGFNTSLLKKHFNMKPLSTEEQKLLITKGKSTKKYLNAKYKCTECMDWFEDEGSFKKHMDRHKIKESITCKVCLRLYVSRRGYSKHLKTHRFCLYKCKICEFQSHMKYKAYTHASVHEGKKYECKICGQAFERQPSYLSHLRIKHPSDFACNLCGYSFLGERGIYCHKKKAHRNDDDTIPDNGPLCEECNIRFKNEKALQVHIRVSPKHGMNEYNDPQRGTIIAQKRKRGRRPEAYVPRNLKIRDHTANILCEQCGAPQMSMRAYNRHFTLKHADVPRSQHLQTGLSLCPHCGKSVKCLQNHLKSHTEGDFVCKICNKTFSTKQCYVNHKVVHEPPKFTCPTCGRKFNQRSNLNRHYTYVHTTVKDVKCEHCDKYFKNKDEMKAHALYVHLKKPWPKKSGRKRESKKRSEENE